MNSFFGVSLPTFFGTEPIVPVSAVLRMNYPLSEPREVSDDERVPDRMLRVLPPEHAGRGAIHDFINEQQHSDDWFSNTLYSDRMYDLFPPAFCQLLDEFTLIMGGSAKPFSVRALKDPDSIERLLELDVIRRKLYDLYHKLKGFYYRTNVYGMRCIALDVLELVGQLLDIPLDV
jgi:hypothetical protein